MDGNGGCSASLSVCSFLLFGTALCVAVSRPYAFPIDNVLHPFKLLLLGTTCIVLLLLSGDEEAVALAIVNGLQTAILVLRIAVKGFLLLDKHWLRRSLFLLSAAGASTTSPIPTSKADPTTAALPAGSRDMSAGAVVSVDDIVVVDRPSSPPLLDDDPHGASFRNSNNNKNGEKRDDDSEEEQDAASIVVDRPPHTLSHVGSRTTNATTDREEEDLGCIDL